MTKNKNTARLCYTAAGILIALPAILTAGNASEVPAIVDRVTVNSLHQAAVNREPAVSSATGQVAIDPRAEHVGQWLREQIERNAAAAAAGSTTTTSAARAPAVATAPAGRQKGSKVTTNNSAPSGVSAGQAAFAAEEPYRLRARRSGSLRQVLPAPGSASVFLQQAVTGAVSRKQQDVDTARTFLRRENAMLGIRNPDTELSFNRRHVGKLGHSHVRFDQSYKGLPIFGSQLIAQLDAAGNMISLNGAYARTPDKKFITSPTLSSVQADLMARSAVEYGQAATAEGEPELMIYLDDARPVLTWRVRLQSTVVDRWSVFVNARSGSIVNKYNEIPRQNVAGSGTDLFGISRPINVWQLQSSTCSASGGRYTTFDASKQMYLGGDADDPATPGVIRIVDAANTPASSDPDPRNASIFYNCGDSPSGPWVPDAVSASFNFSESYDYFLEVHNQDSYNGRGGSMLAVVRLGQGYFNAFYVGNGQMYFGDAVPFAGALDVIAHELGHGVTNETANLIYQDQSGALNESFSDIFGEMAEARTNGGLPDWLKGTGIDGYSKSFENPNSTESPMRMSQFVNTFDDNGGVHINSWIINHAYWLVAVGLPNAIGIADADHIWYRTLTTKLTANSQFIDARLGFIQSADELFGANSPQTQAVIAAMDAIELYDGDAPTPPGPVPGSDGVEDANLFLFWDTSGILNPPGCLVGRLETALGDLPPLGSILTTTEARCAKMSVTGDGSTAVYVNPAAALCTIPTDGSAQENCEGGNLIWSLSISPDGSLAAFVFGEPDGIGNLLPSNTISVVDLATGAAQTYELVAPAPSIDEGVAAIAIEFADALEIMSTNDYVIYDALSVTTLPDGGTFEVWSIYALDLNSGNTIVLIPPIQGLNIGYPALGNTNDLWMTFDVRDLATGNGGVFAADLNTGQVELIAFDLLDWATPAYSGADDAILYSVVSDPPTPTGFDIWRQEIAQDGLTPIGTATLHIGDADVVAPYRRGNYTAGRRVDLSVTGSAGAAAIGLPSTLNYTVTNAGPDTATGVSVRSATRSGVQFGAGSGTGGANCGLDQDQLVCTFAEIPAGGQANVSLEFTPQALGLLRISLASSADQTDENQGNNTTFVEVTVAQAQAPVASFTFSPQNPTPNNAVNFDASSSTDDGSITSYEWDFDGNGTFDATGVTSSFTYTASGTFVVTLRVTDNNGQTDETTRSVTIAEPAPPPPPPPPSGGGGGGSTGLLMLMLLSSVYAFRRRDRVFN
jgi:Zn-dependent metalloprotease/PKD repeat protein